MRASWASSFNKKPSIPPLFLEIIRRESSNRAILPQESLEHFPQSVWGGGGRPHPGTYVSGRQAARLLAASSPEDGVKFMPQTKDKFLPVPERYFSLNIGNCDGAGTAEYGERSDLSSAQSGAGPVMDSLLPTPRERTSQCGVILFLLWAGT